MLDISTRDVFLQATQVLGGLSLLPLALTLCWLEVVAAKTLEAVLVLVTVTLLLSSGFALFGRDFMRSCASALSLSQSLKSMRVGLSKVHLTVCSDHASFMFGGSF